MRSSTGRAALLALAATAPFAAAFFRMSCGIIQTGRLDPVVAPGSVSSHVHKVSGGSAFNMTSTYDELQTSGCTSCEVQDDKSAYWTPQLYYQFANGSFTVVPNGGTVVYYLGRGENKSNIEPFPPGFRMLSGDQSLRSNSTNATTYSDPSQGIYGRPLADRVSFACLDESGPIPEQDWMFRTNCSDGMRAQVHFQSCWNGEDFQADMSHVDYMSQIDNGVCPPSHPRQFIHLFFEVLYSVNNVAVEDGGRFVFAQGDPTGWGFHGDFYNGWNETTLQLAIDQCVNNDTLNGEISLCPVLAASDDPYYNTNCPPRPAIVAEPVGLDDNGNPGALLTALPGCNPVVDGPAPAPAATCPGAPAASLNPAPAPVPARWTPAVGDTIDVVGGSDDGDDGDDTTPVTWTYAGCASDNQNGTGTRALTGPSTSTANMTIAACAAYCGAQGYPLAGVEYASECHCGNSLPAWATADAPFPGCPSQMVCAGNASEPCGGPYLLGVWNDTSASPVVAPVVGSNLASSSSSSPGSSIATYAGCFADPGGNDRALDGASLFAANMTSGACVAFCGAKGFALAGTEYATQCFCGGGDAEGAATATTLSPPSEGQACDMRCGGDVREFCGGSGTLSVWNVTETSAGA
ncbi:hypothetical protein GGR56DRAFT_681157 [Xylariaceae sp. FL0804]|nr:hypothetical protein GGR56DRAFT_681157 [Xylariaceae sp. FL0804]